MTDMHPCSICTGSFDLGWPPTTSLPTPASPVARIIDVSHQLHLYELRLLLFISIGISGGLLPSGI
jgi:hypothetical protein